MGQGWAVHTAGMEEEGERVQILLQYCELQKKRSAENLISRDGDSSSCKY